MKTPTKIAAGIVGIALAASLSACDLKDNNKDLENVRNSQPDYVRNVENMDGQPNVAFLCFQGVPMVTTKRSGAGALHVISIPSAVKFCEGQRK